MRSFFEKMAEAKTEETAQDEVFPGDIQEVIKQAEKIQERFASDIAAIREQIISWLPEEVQEKAKSVPLRLDVSEELQKAFARVYLLSPSDFITQLYADPKIHKSDRFPLDGMSAVQDINEFQRLLLEVDAAVRLLKGIQDTNVMNEERGSENGLVGYQVKAVKENIEERVKKLRKNITRLSKLRIAQQPFF